MTYGPLCFLAILVAVLWARAKTSWFTSIPLKQPLISQDFQPTAQPTGSKTVVWILDAYVPKRKAGSEVMAHAINRHLIQNAGYEVFVIVPGPFPYKEVDGVHIIEMQRQNEVDMALHAARVILSQHFVSELAIRTAAAAKRPLVLILHDPNQDKILEYHAPAAPQGTVHLVANSDTLREHYRRFPYPCMVLNPPVDWRDYLVDTNHKYVTLINLNVNKGGLVLPQIAARIPDIPFLGVKGDYWDQIVLPSVGNITYRDSTSNIKSIYAQTDILLMPSEQESWGYTAIEAMASGIPVIAHPTPGLKESLGSAGLFADRADPEAWAVLIRRLRTDRVLYERQSRLAARRARELEPKPQLEAFTQWIESLRTL